MSNTTFTPESLLLISLPILSGYFKKLCRSYGVTWFVAPMIVLFVTLHASAQGPYCPGFNCTANDVQNPGYFIGNAAGVPIVAVVCTPGQPVNNVYLWLTFTVTAANRYDINVIGDILLDSVYNHTFNTCLGDYAGGTYTVLIEQIVWTCGAVMVVSNNLFSWDIQDDGIVPNTCTVCPQQSSKCHRLGNLAVQAPIVADFSFQSQCQQGQPYEVYTFTSQTSGGILPYSDFTWNFGAGSTPVPSTISGPSATGPFTVTYSSAGVRNVSLTATDNYGNVSTSTQTIDVQPAATASITSNFNPICTGGTATMTATMTSGTATTWLWQYNNAGTWTNVGSNQSTYVTPVLSVGSYTYRIIINQLSNCPATSTITINVIACLGSLTGKVIDTLNVGIQSVNVRLYVDNNFDGLPDPNLGSVKSVNSVSTGVFSMTSIIPGQYVIVQTQPIGYISMSDIDITNDMDSVVNINLNDNIIPATIEPQENDADNIFTEKKVDGIVSGYVFTDLDNDLIVDNGEGLEGVTITLYNDVDHNGIPVAGNIISTKQTSILGYYEFGNLPSEDYILVETEPVAYISAMDIDVSDDNDVVPNTNMTNDIIPFTITLAESDLGNYFTEIQGCGQMVTNANDNGPGSLRYVLDCAEPVDTIWFGPSLQNQTIHLNTSRIEINRNIYIYSNLTPRVKIQSDIPGAFLIDAGFTAEFKNIDFISGLSGYPGAAFENYGHLIFWEAMITRNALLLPNNPLIYNTGAAIMTLKGDIMIENQ
ncbi:MAG: SpaA isopeptide-forming pilin-related protein [Saprospiraceae bacterium]